jgi:hypothetical protein
VFKRSNTPYIISAVALDLAGTINSGDGLNGTYKLDQLALAIAMYLDKAGGRSQTKLLPLVQQTQVNELAIMTRELDLRIELPFPDRAFAFGLAQAILPTALKYLSAGVDIESSRTNYRIKTAVSGLAEVALRVGRSHFDDGP